jgi:SAM-dependent methyltransferase
MIQPPPPLERVDPERTRWYLRGVIAEHIGRYRFAADSVRGKRVLDVACGSGYGCAILAGTAAEVVGVDISPEAVAHAASRYASLKNVRFACGDARRVPVEDERFDVVTSFETIEHLPAAGIDEYLGELHRVLAPGGRAFVSTPDRDSYSLGGDTGNPFHLHEFTRDEFLARLGTRFAVTGVYGQEFAPRWQLRFAKAVAKGPLFKPVARAWRAYKMVVATSSRVSPLSAMAEKVPMVLIAEVIKRA